MGLGGSFHNPFEKRPVLFARASARNMQTRFVNLISHCFLR